MDQAIRLKRLRYRSWHRGCKETDLVLGPFADTQLQSLSAAELDDYERLLEESDADIWNWLVGKADAGAEYQRVMEHLHRFCHSREGGNLAKAST